MRNLFEFLYYCIYRIFRIVKRVGVKDEDLASFFYSILLATNTLMLIFPLKFIIPKGYFSVYPYNIIIKIILASVFFIWYLVCKKYFIQRLEYIRIVDLFDKKINKKTAIKIGLLYMILTFITFIVLANILSRIDRHL